MKNVKNINYHQLKYQLIKIVCLVPVLILLYGGHALAQKEDVLTFSVAAVQLLQNVEKGRVLGFVERKDLKLIFDEWALDSFGDTGDVGARTLLGADLIITGKVRIDGEVTVIYPNVFQQDNFCSPGKVYQVPPENGDFTLEVTPPAGIDRLKAIASPSPIAQELMSGTRGIQFTKKIVDSGMTRAQLSFEIE